MVSLLDCGALKFAMEKDNGKKIADNMKIKLEEYNESNTDLGKLK